MLQHRALLSLCRAVLISLIVFLAFFIWRYPPNTWQIDTNLRSLSPNFVAEKGVQLAVDTVSRSVAQTIFIVLITDSEDELEEAAEVFLSALEEQSILSPSDSLSDVDDFLAVMKQHRFKLISAEQQKWLAQATEKQLRDYLQSRMYGLQSSAQVFGIREDPFGFASNFIFATSDPAAAGEEPIELEENGKTRFALPIALDIAGDALAMATQEDVLGSLDEAKSLALDSYPKLSFLHSGVIFFAADAARKSKSDISIIGAGSMFGIVLLVLFVFRSLRALILPLSSVSFGVALAFAGLHYMFGSVHILTIAFGASLIGVAIDYALHYFYHQSSDYQDKSELPSKRLSDLHRALFLSLLTSVIGYAALSLSGLQSLRHVAIFSVLGLTGAWLVVIAFGPILTKGTQQHRTLLRHSVAAILSVTKKLNLRHFSFICLTLICILSAVLISGLKTSDDPRIFFTPSDELLREEKIVSALVSSYEPGTFLVVRTKNDSDFFEKTVLIEKTVGEDAYAQLFGLQRFIPTLAAQGSAYKLNVSIFGENGSGLAALSDLGFTSTALAKLQAELEQQKTKTLQPQALANSLGESGKNLWLSDADYHYGFLLIPRGLPSNKLAELNALDDDIFFINSATLASQAIQQQRNSASWLVLCAIAFIAVLLLLRHRRLKALVLVLVPTTAIATSIIVLQGFAVPVTLFHTMALFLVLGLGMDYSIFVSEISDSKILTLEAVLLSTLTSLLSFGLLSLSAIPVVKAFGVTLLIGNSINFLGAACLAHYFSKDDECVNADA